MTYDAIVIGAGANGLVAATVLAKAGRKVLVLERGDTVGGTGRPIEFAPGFRAAPLALDPGWLPTHVAKAAGIGGMAPEFAPVPLTLAADRGELLAIPADPVAAAQAIRRHSSKDAESWLAFVQRLRALAGFLEQLYRRPAPATGTPRDLFSLAGLALAYRRLGRADMTALLRTLPMSVQDWLDDQFETDALKAAVAAGALQHIRQGPRSGGTAFVLLHHLVGTPLGAPRRAGVWRGGLMNALEQTARRRGVAIRTSAHVGQVRVRDDAVAGVVLADGTEISAPAVLSTADPARTLLGLVDPVWLDPEFLHAVRRIKFRGATAFVLYALERAPEGIPDAALRGVVTLTAATLGLERAYDASKYGRVSDPPHVELLVPTAAAPEHAPDGRHVAVARVQFAPDRLRNALWDAQQRDSLARAVTSAIDGRLPGFERRVLYRSVLAPPDLETEYALTEGAAYQGEMTLDQVLFMRPLPGWSRHRMPVRGLYLGGAGTHPGGGVIGASGLYAAETLLRDSARGGPRAAGASP